ncbi:MAG: amidohydrolase family protein [Candidatus Marinimicrobia bacterium]|nr:amidohydrolase family protein [Candidatus Neomarinimicrobiota bacterium]
MNDNVAYNQSNFELKAYRARWILPISSPPIEDGVIIVNGDKIQSIGFYDSLNNNLPPAFTDLGDSIIFPGFVNVHTHLEQGELPDPVTDIFQYFHVNELNLREMSEDQRKAVIRQNIDECYKFGTVAIADFSSDGLSGYMLLDSNLFARVFHELNGFKNYEANSIFREHQDLISVFPMMKKTTKHLAPSSTWSVSPLLLKEICVNERHVAIHMAMTPAEMEFILHGKGQIRQHLLAKEDFDYSWNAPRLTPVQYFFSNHFYARHNILMHMVHISDRDIDIIKETPVKVNICLCPRSADTLNLGNAPVKRILEKGVNICLGTESRSLVSDLNMRKEIISCIDKSGVTPETAIKFATLNGAYAIGFHKEVGSLEAGKSARCLIINARNSGINDPYSEILNISQPVRWLGE